MSNQFIGESLETGEALDLHLMGVSTPLKERVGQIFGSAVLSLDSRSAQNIKADDGQDCYLAFGIIVRTEEQATTPPVNTYIRIDGNNDWGFSDEQLTAIGGCAIKRPIRFCHPDGAVLTAPMPVETEADLHTLQAESDTAPQLTLVA